MFGPGVRTIPSATSEKAIWLESVGIDGSFRQSLLKMMKVGPIVHGTKIKY
jgi:hypothetical protein